MVSNTKSRRKTETLESALTYRRVGWSITPLAPGTKKSPRGFRWTPYRKHRARLRQIRTWFSNRYDIAVVLGSVSGGLACRDFDQRGSFDEWRANHSDLAQSLPWHLTERGAHVYFIADENDPDLKGIKCRAHLGDGEVLLRDCQARLCLSDEWIVGPWDGVPRVLSVVSAGLVPASFQNSFSGARARPVDTYHYTPLQDQGITLFDVDGSLSPSSFDHWLGWTIPDGPGARESGIWNACRQLKSLPETRGLPVDELTPIIRRWYELALSKIRTKDYVETYAAWVRAWERAIPFSGSVEMQDILDRARRAGAPKIVVDQFGPHPIGLAAALCRELASLGDGRFFLDCRTLGRLTGVGKSMAAKYMQALIGIRLIRRLTDPEPGKACEYAYLHPFDRTAKRTSTEEARA